MLSVQGTSWWHLDSRAGRNETTKMPLHELLERPMLLCFGPRGFVFEPNSVVHNNQFQFHYDRSGGVVFVFPSSRTTEFSHGCEVGDAAAAKKGGNGGEKSWESKFVLACALLFTDAVLVALIIAYVPYTKIDWDAYMLQVNGILGGERYYENLKGRIGPLIYPAGFLYVYSAIRYVTGGEVYPAQLIWWALSLLRLSKRVHSIFVLRLFNDCFAMMLLQASLASILFQRWHLGFMIFRAVSIKMNVLLYAPPLLLLTLKAIDIIEVISALAGVVLLQDFRGCLLSHFIRFHTYQEASTLGVSSSTFVNFKFVPEQIFVSKAFAVFLLVAYLIFLTAFAHYRWYKHERGILNFSRSILASTKLRFALVSSTPSRNCSNSYKALKLPKAEHIVTTVFVGNFIGIIYARSLHHQFYSCQVTAD